jgi:predicted transcriptional regulator
MKIPITFKIAPERLQRVKSLAEKEHRTVTSVIEWAIDAYCERRERQLKILQSQ